MHFEWSPFVDAAGQPIPVLQFRLFGKHATSDEVASATLRRSDARGKAEQIAHLCSIYEPYTFYGGRFDSSNVERLLAEMSAEERARFYLDVRRVDWMDYVTNVHIPGLRKHVLKSRGSPPSARM
ncbi:hypothetical protein C2845_PM12G14000 [Panicum miliaceum]|uniref:Fatty acyl-CoA reductase C-terminal domain-containing protein n=1 Tax=Panicum miliaceum TaxID=4540 RepID=A0A3L6QE48_PANMI|nr:hypothetical protein C2845_PM12G14000 [Panicum miliaceum]